MRRSQAPSVSKQYKDSTRKGTEWGKETFANSPSRRRYFSVVWRDSSAKKRKIWKSDGILEVRLPSGEAVLRDDSGEYMGSVNVLNILDKLQADYQMLVHNKDIEILEEFRSEEQIMKMRHRLLDGGQELTAQELDVEKKKRKGRFLMPTYLKLNSPKLPKSFDPNHQFTFQINNKQEPSSAEHSLPVKCFMQEYICLVKSSELQQYLFGKVHQFYIEQLSLRIEENPSEAIDLTGTLHMICNHPAFLNQLNTTDALVDMLSSSLPDASEMGPFDSGKLEFLQYFLQNSKACNIVIISKRTDTLNMLQSLCDFMDIKCWRFDSNEFDGKHQQNEVYQSYLKCSNETSQQQVVLMQSSSSLLEMNLLVSTIQYILVFENVNEMADIHSGENMEQWRLMQNEIRIYYLVTAFSIEDYVLFTYLQDDNNKEGGGKDDVDGLLNVNLAELLTMWSSSNHGSYRALQSKTRKPLVCPSTKWMVYESPFPELFIENSALSNCEANLDTILFREFS